MTARHLSGHVALVLALLLGCEEYGQRVYTARPYRAAERCLGPSVPLAVVRAAELPSTCDARCLSLGGALYVSRICAPPPERALELGPGSGECSGALAALRAERTCAALARDAGGDDAGADDASAGDAGAVGR